MSADPRGPSGTGHDTDDFVRFCCGDPECPNDCERETPPGPASVSPADTPEEVILRARIASEAFPGSKVSRTLVELADLADALLAERDTARREWESASANWLEWQQERLALLAVGERDKAEIERLKQGLWDCAIRTGFDNDGDPTPAALAFPDIVTLALREVTALRAEYESELFGRERDRQQIARLTEALRFYADKSKWNYRIGGKQARATYVSYRLAEEALRDVAVLAGEEDAG